MITVVGILKLICILGIIAGLNEHFTLQQSKRQYRNLYHDQYKVDSLITTTYDSLITTFYEEAH